MLIRLLPIGLSALLGVIFAIPISPSAQALQPAVERKEQQIVSGTDEEYLSAKSMLVGYIKTDDQGIDEAKEVCQTEAGLKVVDQSRGSRYVVCTWAGKEGLAKALAVLNKRPELIEYVQPNYQQIVGLPDPGQPQAPPAAATVAYTTSTSAERRPNDTRYNELWGMENMRGPVAWGQVQKTPIVVAVLDSGVDSEHEDLKANMFKHDGKNPKDGKTYPGVIGFDYGSGIDTVTNQYRTGFNGVPSTGPNYLKHPQADHGTHCAGTIGAVGNNNLGVAGVCWEAKIMALQIFTIFDAPGGEKKILTVTQSQIDAIDYAIQNGAKVLSNSYGASLIDPKAKVRREPALEAAYKRANAKGVLIVFAAGNDSSDNDGVDRNPAPDATQHPNAISVAAIGPKETLSFFGSDKAGRNFGSNFGRNKVHVAAPGGDSTAKKAEDGILSTVPPRTELNESKVCIQARNLNGLPARRRCCSACVGATAILELFSRAA